MCLLCGDRAQIQSLVQVRQILCHWVTSSALGIAQAGLELITLQLKSPKYWDYRCVPHVWLRKGVIFKPILYLDSEGRSTHVGKTFRL